MLALALGADVPVCRFGRAAFIGGIGEEIAPAQPLPRAALVLVNPLEPLATNAVFAARRGPYSTAGRFTESPRDAEALAGLLGARRNDLTEAASSQMPEIADMLAEIGATRRCILSRMSGSGATCFGLFAQTEQAAAAAATIAKAHPNWWVVSAPLITNVRSEMA